MSFIYPECPDCGRKHPDGIDLYEMPRFVFVCSYCDAEYEGMFYPGGEKPSVEWTEIERPSRFETIKRLVEKYIL